ncbi:alpha family phenol-soluble modulin [Staphylococcus aureus]
MFKPLLTVGTIIKIIKAIIDIFAK